MKVEVGSIFTILSISGYMFETYHKAKFEKENKWGFKDCSGLVKAEKEVPLFMSYKNSIINSYQWSSDLAWIHYVDKVFEPYSWHSMIELGKKIESHRFHELIENTKIENFQ